MRGHSPKPVSTRRAANGFTLIEAVVAIVLIGVLAMAVIPVIDSGVRTYATTTNSLNALSKLRYATERMAREIREVRRNPSSPTDFEMTLGANTLTFTKITDGNQVTISSSTPNVNLTYQTPAVSGVLTDLLSANTDLSFQYYLADKTTQTASLSQLAYVRISLTLTDSDGAQVNQLTWVALRNQ
jgi:prepilin-type N-terminal cleavage/methylation domain-containing protein